MTETPSPRRSRSRIAERAQQPYAAHADEYIPQQPDAAQPDFAPAPAENTYAAYRPGDYYEPSFQTSDKPAAAPEQPVWAAETPYTAAGNVYRPREVTWAEDDREEAIAESEMGYQVQQEDPEEDDEPAEKHTLRNVLIVLAVLVLVCGGAWLLREPLMEMVGITVFTTAPEQEAFTAVATPEPVKAYDAAPAPAVAEPARNAIASLCGTLDIELHIVTEQHIVARHQRADGSYDFYLFTAADGRLLCYFEGLEALDMMPQDFGGFYVKHAPWLVAQSGSALIRTADIEAALNEKVFLHPMYRGWAVVESLEDGHANYVNASGQVLSTLWFSRTYPFTGDHTLAYVDTGSTAAADGRYLLYVIGSDGSMSRWLASGDMSDAVGAACGMAFMKDGSIYRLPDTSAPVCTAGEAAVYLDCDAMVVRDPLSGKYGLFVHGEQHYDFMYDSIRPLESDMVWETQTLQSGAMKLTVNAISGAAYPQPLSHSFVLERAGQTEYVALSTQSSCPIRLDGEF